MTLPTDAGVERRLTPRRPADRLRVTGLSATVPMQMGEIGLGGFAIQTASPLPAGVHRFRFECDGLTPFEVSAEGVHTCRVPSGDGTSVVLSGFEFLLDGEDALRALEQLIEHLGSVTAA